MPIKITVNNSSEPQAAYVGWAPCVCTISGGGRSARRVTLQNRNPTKGGQLVFMTSPRGPVSDTLSLDLPAGQATVAFYIAGKFDAATGKGYASTRDRDAGFAVLDAQTNRSLGKKTLMVRVRKNANTLTAAERYRFLSALVMLNQQGRFADFLSMHTNDTAGEIHRREAFLPWHRAYLLDLERRLQTIDPSVSLPYWKFDEPAPKVFYPGFMGENDATGLVSFASTNPLVNWRLPVSGMGSGRIRRLPRFNTRKEKAGEVAYDEATTLGLGERYTQFWVMEGDPHGAAHVSFEGQIASPGTAPADPLFFMLHANVDRLWAKWQWATDGYRFNPAKADTYPLQGQGNNAQGGRNGVGNFTRDTLWPWNGVAGRPRPATAPGGPYTTCPTTAKPGPQPTLGDMIDYQGQYDLTGSLGFAYDDVPYDF